MFDVWDSLAKLRQPCLMRPVPQTGLGSDGLVSEALLTAIDHSLWEEVERHILESDLPSFQHEGLYTQDKWLTTSALQKCVRRGNTKLAKRYAHSGVRIDADHTFRRLAIIALEDVGLGDLKLIAAVLAVLGDKRRRQRIGEERLGAFLAAHLSKAVKCRLACELLSLVDYDTRATDLARALVGRDERALASVIRTEEFGSARQMVSLLVLHGTDRIGSRAIPCVGGQGVEGMLRLLTVQGAPLVFHYIVRRALSRCRDSLALPYVLFPPLLEREAFQESASARATHLEMIGPYPAAAFDMHTRAGRSAIRRYDVHWADQLRSAGVKNVSNLVFALEGGLLDRPLQNPRIDEISETATHLEVFGKGGARAAPELSRLVLSPHLNLFRRQAAASAR